MRFHFQMHPQGADFDDNGPNSTFKSPSNADLQHQLAIGSAIAYYHRPAGPNADSWKEPPNFFNPFWRATLYAADDDVDAYLTKAGSYADQSKALKLLIKQDGWVGTR
jgi:hypothetical protein